MHTTRGRANTLRLAMSGQLSSEGLTDPVLKEALDLCLSCKACKAECPSSVDMARLKSEVLQHQYKAHGVAFRDRLIRESSKMARRFSGMIAPVVNTVQSSGAFRYAMEKTGGFSHKRKLPAYASRTFEHWFNKNYAQIDGPDVVLFADTYLNYHEPQIGKAAMRLINQLGYNVVLMAGCCQRPRISHGFLEVAKQEGTVVAEALDQYLRNEVPVLVCEPGCASALTDDLPDLIDDIEISGRMQRGIVPIETWVSQRVKEGTHQLHVTHPDILLHGHCHQKALFGTGSVHHILTEAGATVFEPDSGCCGMASSFGYEKEHYAISEKMFQRVLGPSIENHSASAIVASGFSCRHQIEHFTGRKAMHWVEVIGDREAEAGDR